VGNPEVLEAEGPPSMVNTGMGGLCMNKLGPHVCVDRTEYGMPFGKKMDATTVSGSEYQSPDVLVGGGLIGTFPSTLQ